MSKSKVRFKKQRSQRIAVVPARPYSKVRAAFAQPRVLLSGMALLLIASVWWAGVQHQGPRAAENASASAQQERPQPFDWKDLPRLMKQYGEGQAAARQAGTQSGFTQGAVAGASMSVRDTKMSVLRSALTEQDLTPNNNSDERDATYRTDGNLIAFASTGADTNGDQQIDSLNTNGAGGTPRYHIWVMNPDGSQQRQITGLNRSGLRDSDSDQREPTFSVDNNSIAYINNYGTGAAQIFQAQRINNVSIPPTFLPLTSFPVRAGVSSPDLLSPVFSPSGSMLAFVAKFNTIASRTVALGSPTPSFDIYTISATGSRSTPIRLTGGSADPVGDAADDLNPVYYPPRPTVLFFSTNRTGGTVADNPATTTVNEAQTPQLLPTGRRIYLMDATTGINKSQVTNPLLRPGGSLKDVDDFPSFAQRNTTGSFGGKAVTLVFQSSGFIDITDRTNDFNVWSLPANQPFEVPSQIARVESNTLSSPAGVKASGVKSVGEDKVADIEPAGSQLTVNSGFGDTGNVALNIAFSSQRINAGVPLAAGTTTNPGGGPNGTYDIWTTNIEDITPPILTPVTVGSQNFPFLAPGPQATQARLVAPRTAEEGLVPNGIVRVGFVLQDTGSGLGKGSVVYVLVKDANAAQVEAVNTAADYGKLDDKTDYFATQGFPAPVPPLPAPTTFFQRLFGTADNPDISVNGAPVGATVEIDPKTGGNPFTFAPPTQVAVVRSARMITYDDGPVSQRGHERQAGAVAGDGIYYCEGALRAPPQASDFYMDVAARDVAGNTFVYDNVYGFSTQPFSRSNNLLFVSDYTVGQLFPARLASFGLNVIGFTPRTLFQTEAAESYYLFNPSGTIKTKRLNFADGKGKDFLVIRTQEYFPNNGEASGPSMPSSDVWRVLSRGPLPQNIIDQYLPTTAAQVDPTQFLSGNTVNRPVDENNPIPAQIRQRPVTLSNSFVLWGAPYAGDVFAGPGTIVDTNEQSIISNFLNRGGRLFLTGNDILFSLSANSANGQNSSDFLSNELRASFAGEITTESATTIANEPSIAGRAQGYDPDPLDSSGVLENDPPEKLQFTDVVRPVDRANTYADAVLNPNQFDIISPLVDGNGDVTVTPIYGYASQNDVGGAPDAGIAAQRIEHRNRADGSESRVVFFGFGLENINRGYRNNKIYESRNFRAKVVDNVRNYLTTGGISGRVINLGTNTGAGRFLVVITRFTGPLPRNNFATPTGLQESFVAITRADGTFDIQGLPPGNYVVSPAQFIDASGMIQSFNGAFFPAASVFVFDAFAGGVQGGQTTPGVNLTVNPVPPGSISGRAVNDANTRFDISDDFSPAANVPVLLRTMDKNNQTFGLLTQTDLNGQFAFSNVPGRVAYEIVFNPTTGFESQGGDIPDNSAIVYPSPLIQQNPNFARRVIPVDDTPSAQGPYPNFRINPILVQPNKALDLGDVPLPPGSPIVRGTPTPVPTPGTAPGLPTNVNSQISLPFASSTADTATITPGQAFTLPVFSGATRNYDLLRFDAVTRQYVPLDNNSLLRRGEGYFVKPLVSGLKIRSAGAGLVPLPASQNTFTLTLRANPSVLNDPLNGQNLIGFPFNPVTYSSINWLDSRVSVNGVDRGTVRQAAAAGIISASLSTLGTNSSGQQTSVPTQTMVPFTGYFARVFVDNVQVTLIGVPG